MPPFSSGAALDKKALDFILPTVANGVQQSQRPDLQEAKNILTRDLSTPLLDELYTNLWLVAKRSGASIDALHVHNVKGMRVVPAEDASLHLVWHHDRIYIKPMPQSLLNHDFWIHALPDPLENPPENDPQVLKNPQWQPGPQFDRKIALGFLRSYAYLIQHPLDLTMAQEAHLLPGDITWVKWTAFIKNFRHLDDSKVSNRYHYGQLRISRLNWAVRLCRPKNASTLWFYMIPHWSMEKYLKRAITPLLFIFANLSLVLSSMQVMLAASDGDAEPGLFTESGVRLVRIVFWRFSIIILVLSLVIWFLLVILPIGGLSWQLSWGCKNRTRRTSTA